MRIFEHRIFFLSLLAGKFAIIEQMLLTELKKTAHAYYKHPYFSKFFGGKNKNFWTALNTSFFSERQKIVLEKVQLNRVIIFPYIFLLTRRVLERNIPILFCSSVKSCLSLLFDSRLKHQRYSPFILQEIENNW